MNTTQPKMTKDQAEKIIDKWIEDQKGCEKTCQPCADINLLLEAQKVLERERAAGIVHYVGTLCLCRYENGSNGCDIGRCWKDAKKHILNPTDL